MKKFTVIPALFTVSILAAWVSFQVFAASTPKNDNAPSTAHEATAEVVGAVHTSDEAAIAVTGAEARRIAPVFDTTGAVVSDPSGTLLNAIHSGDRKIAPVYDATGELVSDPTGTMLGGIKSADVKVAPVYDATGALMSDPTGTIWSANSN